MYQRAWAAPIAALCIFPSAVMGEDSQSKPSLGEAKELPAMTVVGTEEKPSTHLSSPPVRVTEETIQRYNAPTVEDVVKYEPSLIVRRRFIGDPNGTLGIRGANMFQTTRSLVYGDGLPLHYMLQTQFNGRRAGRWWRPMRWSR